MLRLRKVAIAASLACVLAAPALPQATATPPELKVAFTGDQSLGEDPEEVLRLIAAEGAEAVFIQGDFDYADDPAAWEAMLDATLGPDFPVIALVGNHDEAEWYGPGGYQDRLAQRMQRLGLAWLGELGVQATLHYNGLFVVQTAPDIFDGYDHAAFIASSLAADSSIWSISAWHKLMSDMQVGGKGDETGWEVYEASRRGGAIIATAHEHSYSRTHLLSSMESQTVASTAQPLALAADDPGTDEDEGRSFAFVSGLGGSSIRDQERSTGDWWASVYTSTQGASNGALFAVFHVNGDPRLARFYFKDVTGRVVDDFLVRSTLGETEPPTPEPSGQYPFRDKSTGSANTSFLNVDTGGSRVCVAGRVQGSDGAASVQFSYESLGRIDKASDERVRGAFGSVRLTLEITGGTAPAYGQMIEATCKLKAGLQKAGLQSKVRLRCDLGDQYSAFAGLTPEQVLIIDNAFAHQKRAKASSKNGRLKVSHAGVPSAPGVPVSCSLPR